MTNEQAKIMHEELVRDEGLRLKSYKDSVGLWTIGVGHLLGDTQRMFIITAEEAGALLALDLSTAEGTVARLGIGPEIGEVRWRALVNMAFNLGGRLQGFVKFLNAVRVEDWATAGEEMMNSKWATQVGARAVRLRKMIETGTA